MASKSKKRRRVLGASCILAALIIAGSSFAWFTSKDEVTNRLTASSDYGVSIVESFVPPKNWIPGQEINKDVYAVNTGNVDAFVKEDVSGILNYTYESLVNSFDTAHPEKYVELNENIKEAIDGATTEEAGGFLVWTNAKVEKDGVQVPAIEPGSVNSARLEDNVAETWHPTVAGDYIFRRSIDTTAKDSENNPITTFTYAGYHYEPAQGTEGQEGYVPAKYYKIVIGKDVNPNGQVFDISSDLGSLGVKVDEDGILQSDPIISYVVETKVENAKPILTYVAKTDPETRDYLQVYYSPDAETSQQIEDLAATVTAAQTAVDDAQAAYYTALQNQATESTDLAKAENDLRNAEAAYNSAKSRYLQTKYDSDYANTLATATNTLVDAAMDAANAQADYQKKLDALNEAAKNLNAGADSMDNAAYGDPAVDGKLKALKALLGDNNSDTDKLSPKSLIPAEVRSFITSRGQDGQSDLTNANQNLTLFDNYWSAIQQDINDLDAAYGAANTAAKIRANASATDYTSATDPANTDGINDNYDIIKATTAKLRSDFTAYKNAYADFVSSLESPSINADGFPEDYLTGLKADTTAPAWTDADSNIDDQVNFVKETNAANELKDLVDAYVKAYNEFKEADAARTSTSNDWTEAIKTYNKTVGDAKTTYTSNVGQSQTQPNDFTTDKLTDNSSTLVPGAKSTSVTDPGYSAVIANSPDNTKTDPKIAENTQYSDYVTIAGTADPTTGIYNVTRDLVRTTPNDFPQVTANAKDDANPDPKLTLSQLKQAMDQAEGAVNDESTGKQKLFNDAKKEKDTADANVKAAKETLDNAKNALTQAQTVYDREAGELSTINIKILLDKDWNQNWTMDPDTDKTQVVDFYLNKILTAGETSEKLIDAVIMDDSMTAKDYKDLTFDLNVGLNSVQVTYDANQRDYTTETVDADPNFAGMKATVTSPSTEGSAVTWANKTVTYSVDGTTVTPKSVSLGDYKYMISIGGKNYYGKSLTDTFVEGTDDGSAVTVKEGGATKTITVTEAP